MITITVRMLSSWLIPSCFTGRALSDTGAVGYLLNGQYHRLDGPAVIFSSDDYSSQYYIFGKRFEPKDYWKQPLVIKTVIDKINSLNARGETI